MEIYNPVELKKSNLIQKLVGRNPAENGIREINNLFANNQSDIERITLEDIVELAEKYKINLKKRFNNQRLDLFQKYMDYCLIDSKLEDHEVKALKHIKDILFLNRQETQDLIKRATEQLYEKHVKEAVSDGILEDIEKAKLEKLKHDLLISDDIADKIYETNAREILQKFIDGVISEEGLSPDEEKEFNEIANSLNIDLNIDKKTKQILERYKLYWQLENGEIPEIIPDIILNKSERLYFKTKINCHEQRKVSQWYEHSWVSKRIDHSGPASRIKTRKGFYSSIAAKGAQSGSKILWNQIDSGNIYLTNKRLIFVGNKVKKVILIKRIADLTPGKKGVIILKDNGKSHLLEFSANVDLFTIILTRLMDECQN